MLTACQVTIPKWDGDIYQGWPDEAAIVRKQANQKIECKQPEFKEYMCMSWDDFKSFTETYVLGCKEWKPGLQMQKVKVEQVHDALKAPEMPEDYPEPTPDYSGGG